MSLYKYVPPERLDVLKNLRIRVTQPGAQNDPFEFRPLVGRFRSPDNARKDLSKKWDRQFSQALSQANPALQEFVRMRPACVSSLKVLGVAKADRQSDPAALEEIFQQLNWRVGILSLSEVPDSFLMWWRYASGQAGFVYEFDDKHPWFWAKTEGKDDTHELRKVSYVDVPSSPYLAELSESEVLYTKRSVWEYEKEWRIIRPFVESSQRVGEDVYLFDIPPAALTGVIVGSSATEDSLNELAHIVTANPQLSHVRIGCADHTPSEQTVNFEFWPDSVARIRETFGRAS